MKTYVALVFAGAILMALGSSCQGVAGLIGALMILAAAFCVGGRRGAGRVLAVLAVSWAAPALPGGRLFPAASSGGSCRSPPTCASRSGRGDSGANRRTAWQATLRPAGFAEIGGRRVDVVTRGENIESGAAVKVLEVEGNRVVVCKV